MDALFLVGRRRRARLTRIGFSSQKDLSARWLPTTLPSVNFEWDEDKNQKNIRKHGLDFADAWEIFEAPMQTALDKSADYEEDRWTAIGLLGNRVVVVVFTERDED